MLPDYTSRKLVGIATTAKHNAFSHWCNLYARRLLMISFDLNIIRIYTDYKIILYYVVSNCDTFLYSLCVRLFDNYIP